MKKKIFIAIFFIMICLPSLGMFFYKTDISAEKREVQTFPKVKENGKVNIWVGNTLNGKKVIVQDTGIGIPKEHQDRIFERFYRVDKSHSREIGGTGLGLAITKSAVVAHRGAIKVQSKLGEGTTFTVRIPLRYIV